jgi:diguanylate cyclase (GGDEF)-like protein
MKKVDKKTLLELYNQSGLFEDLATNEIETLSTHGEYMRYAKESAILTEAPVAGHVFMIHEGDVVISRGRHGKNEVVLARYLSGECFGELDLFTSSGNPVTVRAESETNIVVFPGWKQDSRELFAAYPDIGAKILKNLLSMVAKRIRSTNQLLSQRSPWVQELRKQVYIDKLTGLYNKTWLLEELERELAEKRAGTALLIVKPDNFKVINDTYGHEAGDKTLSLLGGSIERMAKSHGIAARHGGDVFAVVYKNANAREVHSFANEIVKNIRNLDLEPITGNDTLTLTVSVGTATRKPGLELPIAEVMESAFSRMLAAREEGGDRIAEAGDKDGEG